MECYIGIPVTRIRQNVGVLAPLGDKVRHLIDTARFVTIIDGCDMDKTLPYLAYQSSA